jgi:hypothetical protein
VPSHSADISWSEDRRSERVVCRWPRSYSQAVIYAQALLQWLRSAFPAMEPGYGRHLATLDLNAMDMSVDKTTLGGFGRARANPLVEVVARGTIRVM